MIIGSNTKERWQTMASFLSHYAGVRPTTDLQMLGWYTDNELKIVVGFNAFLGKTCQMHLALTKGFHFIPRALREACFDYAFRVAGRELVIGILNSHNVKALEFDTKLGFKEMYRILGMHDDGGDIVVLGMYSHECRYLGEENVQVAASALH